MSNSVLAQETLSYFYGGGWLPYAWLPVLREYGLIEPEPAPLKYLPMALLRGGAAHGIFVKETPDKGVKPCWYLEMRARPSVFYDTVRDPVELASLGFTLDPQGRTDLVCSLEDAVRSDVAINHLKAQLRGFETLELALPSVSHEIVILGLLGYAAKNKVGRITLDAIKQHGAPLVKRLADAHPLDGLNAEFHPDLRQGTILLGHYLREKQVGVSVLFEDDCNLLTWNTTYMPERPAGFNSIEAAIMDMRQFAKTHGYSGLNLGIDVFPYKNRFPVTPTYREGLLFTGVS